MRNLLTHSLTQTASLIFFPFSNFVSKRDFYGKYCLEVQTLARLSANKIDYEIDRKS